MLAITPMTVNRDVVMVTGDKMIEIVRRINVQPIHVSLVSRAHVRQWNEAFVIAYRKLKGFETEHWIQATWTFSISRTVWNSMQGESSLK